MKILHILYCTLLFISSSLYAEGQIRERVFVHTDKEYYVAGEDIWVKFYVVNSDFHPSNLSKVGYIEICDTQKPQMQLKLALDNGSGAGKIKIPGDIPSGIYQLSGYTRYMRNEGEPVFFKRRIAIVNMNQQLIPDRAKIITPAEIQPEKKYESGNILIKTDRNHYSNREMVRLSLSNLPQNISDLVVSVSRNDSVGSSLLKAQDAWIKQVADEKTSAISDQTWLPEYEGHIISGHIVSGHVASNTNENLLLSSISFLGKEIRYIGGEMSPDNKTISFYTRGIFGSQDIASSISSFLNEKIPSRIDITTPFCEFLPEKLPVLEICPNEKLLIERSVGAQLPEIIRTDTLNKELSQDYYRLKPSLNYDLDQYTRFNTLSETILEFVNRVRVSKVNGKRKIRVFLDETDRYNSGNTLVLLDGIPVYDHEELLKYNPQNVKMIQVYDGRYVFGTMVFDGIVSFVTYHGDIPFFQLSEGYQLIKYDCPSLPLKFESPDYSNETIRNSRKPDFRHTLYWNPFVTSIKNQSTELSFFTSDLSGDFKVTVEGITTDGKMIYSTLNFNVK